MPKVTIWVRVEDHPKWQAIKNKPEWLHERLNNTAFEIDPNKRYMIVFNNRVISQEDVHKISESFGNKSIMVIVDGDPAKLVKVIERDDRT